MAIHTDDIEREAANDVVEAKLADLTGTLLAERALIGPTVTSCGRRGPGGYSCNRPRDHRGDMHAEFLAPLLDMPVQLRALWVRPVR